MPDLSNEEVYIVLKNIKNGEATGTNKILPEFLKILDPRASAGSHNSSIK
jgi:hypothetical protein